jgi:Zn-dependent protease with chaperone function
MGKFRQGRLFDTPRLPVMDFRGRRFANVVHEVSAGLGIEPPGWIAVLSQNDRRSNAMALRVGRKGSGFIIISPGIVDDLNDDELRFVVRHELEHYRHAEARWSLLQAFAFLSPVIVYVYGWPISREIGKWPTVALYFLALLAHVLAFKSKRWLEERADREAIRHSGDAVAAKNALLKVATLKKRRSLGLNEEDGWRLIEEFSVEAHHPTNFSNRLFNRIWGTHPLIQDRLALYEKLAK